MRPMRDGPRLIDARRLASLEVQRCDLGFSPAGLAGLKRQPIRDVRRLLYVFIAVILADSTCFTDYLPARHSEPTLALRSVLSLPRQATIIDGCGIIIGL